MDGGLIALMAGLVACSSWKVKDPYSFKMKPFAVNSNTCGGERPGDHA